MDKAPTTSQSVIDFFAQSKVRSLMLKSANSEAYTSLASEDEQSKLLTDMALKSFGIKDPLQRKSFWRVLLEGGLVSATDLQMACLAFDGEAPAPSFVKEVGELCPWDKDDVRSLAAAAIHQSERSVKELLALGVKAEDSLGRLAVTGLSPKAIEKGSWIWHEVEPSLLNLFFTDPLWGALTPAGKIGSMKVLDDIAGHLDARPKLMSRDINLWMKDFLLMHWSSFSVQEKAMLPHLCSRMLLNTMDLAGPTIMGWNRICEGEDWVALERAFGENGQTLFSGVMMHSLIEKETAGSGTAWAAWGRKAVDQFEALVGVPVWNLKGWSTPLYAPEDSSEYSFVWGLKDKRPGALVSLSLAKHGLGLPNEVFAELLLGYAKAFKSVGKRAMLSFESDMLASYRLGPSDELGVQINTLANEWGLATQKTFDGESGLKMMSKSAVQSWIDRLELLAMQLSASTDQTLPSVKTTSLRI